MKFIDNLLDKASHAMKSFVGENERLRLIEECKKCVSQYENQLDQSRTVVNQQIGMYNDTVPLINQKRRSEFKAILVELHTFLQNFGNIGVNNWGFSFEFTKSEQLGFREEREIAEYRNNIAVFEKTENQIFDDAVKGVIFGLKIENKKQNLQIEQVKNDIALAVQKMQNEYATMSASWRDRTEIAHTYLDCIELICETINTKIVSELEMILAFLKAESVKNLVISDQPIHEVQPADISIIKGTIYGKHYTFVKNAFLFYILSREIYQSPILTRIAQPERYSDCSNDKYLLYKQKEVLEQQADILSADIMG